MKAFERLLDYVTFDTAADINSSSVPSSDKQLVLGKYLLEQLHALGVDEAWMSEYGYVYACLKGNVEHKCDTVGFIAHMDTNYEYPSANVKPRIINNWDGSDIVLENGLVTSCAKFKNIKRYIGHDIIVTDGNTLLGADDKAGIAIIMSLLQHLKTHPEIMHGDIKVAFSVDEEIGRGADHFDVEKFAADYAYTIDGSNFNEVSYETFNAASATIKIKGVSVHPGSAKNIMINALNVAHEFHALLPSVARPEHTCGYEGFYHLNDMHGGVENAQLEYIVRDHDKAKFMDMLQTLQKNADYLNDKYAQQLIEVIIEHSYANMKEELIKYPHIIDLPTKCLQEMGYTAICEPVRGGTDGARLTFMNLPCPNLGTGGDNFHGPHEMVSINEMELVLELLIKMVEKVAKC